MYYLFNIHCIVPVLVKTMLVTFEVPGPLLGEKGSSMKGESSEDAKI